MKGAIRCSLKKYRRSAARQRGEVCADSPCSYLVWSERVMSVMCEKSRPVMTRRHSTTSLASSSRCDCFIRFALAFSGSAGLLVAELATSFRFESGPQSSTEGVDGTDESSWSFDGGSVPGSCAEGPVSVSGSDAVSDSASVSDAGADFRLRIANRPPAASARLFFPSNRSICLPRTA